MIVAQASVEMFDPTVDSQVIQLKASGADTFFNATMAKFGTQAIRKVYDIGWKPMYLINYPATSIPMVQTVWR